ncbi:hypothetical protein [Streptomyces anulatus]|uniref:hypothetical protein n=1 Tax=Streptomyces anulatus TaxID=1892 RepID=UPI00368A8154
MEPDTVDTPVPTPLPYARYRDGIMRAGKVASATLVCHRDTREFVPAQVSSHPHFRTPTLEERENGLVAVLSGRSLVAVLLALYRVAIASTAWSGEGNSVIVTIDNRVPARA